MKTSSTRSLFENIKTNRNPGLNEFSSLLHLLPDPAVLVEGTKRTILIGNTNFYKSFLLTRTEVQNQPLASIFEDQEDRPLRDKQESLRAIHRPHRISIPVSVQEYALDLGQYWYVLTFSKLSELANTSEKNSDLANSLFAEILEFDQSTDCKKWQSLLINRLSSHFSFENFTIYQATPGRTELSQVVSSGSNAPLPDLLPASDIIRLQEPIVWTPGKRVLTELHRSARIQGYSFLASAPITNGLGETGLFVFGDCEKQPLKDSLSLAKLIAQIISNRIQSQDLHSNLEKKLKENTNRLEVLETEFENNPEGICIIDQSYKLLSLNPAAEWLLGYANWEVVNQPIENVLIGPKNLTPGLEAASKGIATPNIQETSLHHRDGHSFPVQLQITPVVKNDTVSSILICFKDISEHEEIVARTQQLEHRALLGDVTSVFAHEVRNPVNNISTGLQLLSSRLAKDDPNQEVLARIQSDCTRFTPR
jgi:two-component system sensor histidine kinase AtoS